MKRFKSVTGKPVRLAQLSGHVAVVTAEYAELHERFHADAYANGCVSEDMIKNKALEDVPLGIVDKLVDKADLEKRIYAVMDKIMSGEIENAMTNNGPDARIISTHVGERITSKKRDELWYKYQQDLDTE